MITTTDGPQWVTVIDPDKLRAARLKTGVAQVWLARETGLSQQFISRLESGRDSCCRFGAASRIVACLGVELEDLFAVREYRTLPKTATGPRVDSNSDTAAAADPALIAPSPEYPDGDPRVWWTMQEFAALMRIHIDTAYAMRRTGEVGSHKRGLRWFVPDTEVVRLSREAAAQVVPAA